MKHQLTLTDLSLLQTDSHPTFVRLSDELTDSDRLIQFLTVKNKSVSYQLHKARQKNYSPKYISSLVEKERVCLLFFHSQVGYYTLAGLKNEIEQFFKIKLKHMPIYPQSRSLPYLKLPPKLRPYQQEAVQALLKAKHGAIELPTGSGKTMCLVELIRHHGLKTLVVTPSASITEQIYKLLQMFFGPKYIGLLRGATKKTDKLITVATAQSLVKLSPESSIFKDLSKSQVLIFDESHTCPAETFKTVCLGVSASVPYRYFVSATQMRTDGLDLLLKGLSNEIVYRKTFKDLSEDGYLARPIVQMYKIQPNPLAWMNYENPLLENKNHLFYNPFVIQKTVEIIENFWQQHQKPILVLIEELEQFEVLKNNLKLQPVFIHGQTPIKERTEIINKFNNGEIPLLIGTSAIGTGVDLLPVHCLVYLQGGKSEIQLKQAIGRGTRIVNGKKQLLIVDFLVEQHNLLKKHANVRLQIYRQLTDQIEILD